MKLICASCEEEIKQDEMHYTIENIKNSEDKRIICDYCLQELAYCYKDENGVWKNTILLDGEIYKIKEVL